MANERKKIPAIQGLKSAGWSEDGRFVYYKLDTDTGPVEFGLDHLNLPVFIKQLLEVNSRAAETRLEHGFGDEVDTTKDLHPFVVNGVHFGGLVGDNSVLVSLTAGGARFDFMIPRESASVDGQNLVELLAECFAAAASRPKQSKN